MYIFDIVVLLLTAPAKWISSISGIGRIMVYFWQSCFLQLNNGRFTMAWLQ